MVETDLKPKRITHSESVWRRICAENSAENLDSHCIASESLRYNRVFASRIEQATQKPEPRVLMQLASAEGQPLFILLDAFYCR